MKILVLSYKLFWKIKWKEDFHILIHCKKYQNEIITCLEFLIKI